MPKKNKAQKANRKSVRSARKKAKAQRKGIKYEGSIDQLADRLKMRSEANEE